MSIVVVVDTNVFVGALKSPGGANREIIRLCLKSQLAPLMGAALFAEFESVMARDNLFHDCLLDVHGRDALLDAFLSICRWHSIHYLWRPNLRDEADNHIVELAVTGGASAIVTNNVRDFRGGQLTRMGPRILRPVAMIRELENEPWEP